MIVTVFCGSSSTKNENIMIEAYRLGKLIAFKGSEVVYGGSSTGLMGQVARGCLDNGGKVTGIVPNVKLIMDRQVKDLTKTIYTDSMHERKQLMFDMADIFVALPGGIGTIDEMAEAMTLVRLGVMDTKKCIYINVDGFYDDLKHQFEKMYEEGLLYSEDMENTIFIDTVDEIISYLQ